MGRVRAILWAAAIGVLSVLLAAILFRVLPGGGVAFAVLLVVCVALLSGLFALLAEIPASVGAGGGAFGAVLVAVVLGVTIALAPLGLGARRPGFQDLLWKPLLALLALIAVCAAAGWAGVRLGLRLTRRRGGDAIPPV
jgi:uncharacterized membrane protein YhaH (DUF805 family)